VKAQVVTPRMSNRSSLAGAGRASSLAQRPARRGKGSAARSEGRFSSAMSLAVPIGKVALAIGVGVLIFAAYRAAASASLFQARAIDVSGTTRSEEISKAVRRSLASTGTWKANLQSLSAELVENLPWVRTAIVSRVLPDGLRVRVVERVPRAVARTSSGRLMWVDEEGVVLAQMTPADRIPSFFIRGWDEARTGSGTADNRRRVAEYLTLARDWETAGLSERVSEVDLADLRDIRVQLAGRDSQIEVRLGGDDLTNRLRRALGVLDEQRNTTCGPFITYLVVTQKNTIVGLPPGMQPCASSANTNSGEGQTDKISGADVRDKAAARNGRKKEAEAKTSRGRRRPERD
jgi:cell division septal protein FtsQ